VSIVRPEDLIVTEIVGDLDICCDNADHVSCPKDRAEWILHRVPCACGFGGAMLACTPCKDYRLLSEGAVFCACGEVISPAKHAYSFIEPISRPR
jgi:hypothetical protein